MIFVIKTSAELCHDYYTVYIDENKHNQEIDLQALTKWKTL